MLHCVAVCSIVLQCVAMCCNVLQCVAVCCSALQCDTDFSCFSWDHISYGTTFHGNTFHSWDHILWDHISYGTTFHWSTFHMGESHTRGMLQRVAVCFSDIMIMYYSAMQYAAVCCSMLQCVAVCCSMLQCVDTLQCVAVSCSVLQCVAVC